MDNLGHVGNMNKDSSSSQGGSMVRFRLLPAVNGSNRFDAVHDPSPGFRNTVCEVGQQLLMMGTGKIFLCTKKIHMRF